MPRKGPWEQHRLRRSQPCKGLWERSLRRSQPCRHHVFRLYTFQNVGINVHCLNRWIWVHFLPVPCTAGEQTENFVPAKQAHFTGLVRKNGCLCVLRKYHVYVLYVYFLYQSPTLLINFLSLLIVLAFSRGLIFFTSWQQHGQPFKVGMLCRQMTLESAASWTQRTFPALSGTGQGELLAKLFASSILDVPNMWPFGNLVGIFFFPPSPLCCSAGTRLWGSWCWSHRVKMEYRRITDPEPHRWLSILSSYKGKL